jgi:hypothetical protein
VLREERNGEVAEGLRMRCGGSAWEPVSNAASSVARRVEACINRMDALHTPNAACLHAHFVQFQVGMIDSIDTTRCRPPLRLKGDQPASPLKGM